MVKEGIEDMKSMFGKEVSWMKYIVEANGKTKEFNKEGACLDYRKKMQRKGYEVKVFYEDSATARTEIFKK